MKSKIAVLIPCYNESKTIGKVVNDFKSVLPEADVYVYDNNSSDHTDEIAREAGVPIMHNVQLARSLYSEGTENSYIPNLIQLLS